MSRGATKIRKRAKNTIRRPAPAGQPAVPRPPAPRLRRALNGAAQRGLIGIDARVAHAHTRILVGKIYKAVYRARLLCIGKKLLHQLVLAFCLQQWIFHCFCAPALDLRPPLRVRLTCDDAGVVFCLYDKHAVFAHDHRIQLHHFAPHAEHRVHQHMVGVRQRAQRSRGLPLARRYRFSGLRCGCTTHGNTVRPPRPQPALHRPARQEAAALPAELSDTTQPAPWAQTHRLPCPASAGRVFLYSRCVFYAGPPFFHSVRNL